MKSFFTPTFAVILALSHHLGNAATITKSATGTDLAAGASWGGTAPGSGDIATWTSASLGAALTLDSNTTWNGIAISGALGDIGITGAGTLTLGASGIDLSSTTRNLTMANNLVLASSQTWNVASGRTLTASGILSGGFSLTKSGAGTVTLTAPNSYTGGLVINSGIVTTNAAASVSSGGTGTGPITVNSGGRLTLNSGVGTLNRALTLNQGSLFFAGSGSDLTFAGTIALAANSTIDATNNNSGFPAISANISGIGGFTKTNSGGLRLNGTNTYTGPTVVSAGGVTVKSSLYGNDTTKWTPANITVAGGATLTLNVHGTTEFTIAQAATLFGQLSTGVNNNGLLAGSFIGVDTRNAPAGTYTYSANITDSTGTGGGAVSFKHTGTSSTILELTGTNTYSGMTIVDNDAFLKVSSLNSVVTNAALGTVRSASSSLGAPTTVANGTIHLGTAGSTAQSAIGNTFRGGSLIYTGTGETTDRVISLNGGGGETYVLDQSGTGHLKFLGSFASIDTRAIKTLTLRGSTAGTAELAGTIPNASNGNNQLTKSGTGTWTLSGSNFYAGVTTLSGGVLSVSTISNGGLTPTLTTTASSATVIASSTAGLVVGQTINSSKIPVGATIATIVDSTTFTLNSGTGVTAGITQTSIIGTSSNLGFATTAATNLVFNGGTLRYTGATASTNRSYTINASTTATFDVTANNLTLTGASTATNGALTKTGLGTLTLAGANLATGITTVNGGTLAITGTTSSTSVAVNNTGRLLVQNTAATGSAPVTINNGGSLGGSGSISGTVTVNNGGSIALDATGSTLSLASATSPTFAAFGSLKINAASNTLDRVLLTNASANFACGNLDLVIDTTGLPRAFSAVEIVRTTKSNGVTGTFRSVSVIGDPSYTASVAYAGNSITLTLSGGSSTLPSAYKIQVAGNSSAITTAGTGVNLTVTALDSFGATLTAFNGDSALSFYGLATSPNSTAATVSDKTGLAKNATLLAATPNTTLTFVNGIATTSASSNGVLTPSTAAVSTVHCFDGFVSSASGLGASGLSLTVNPAAISSYSVTASSPQGTATPFATTVSAKDAFGNTVTSDNSTAVTLTSSTGNAQFDSDGNGTYGDNTKTLASGTFNITTKDDVTETVTLTATSSGGKTGTSSPITIATSSAKDILTFTFPTFGAAIITGTNITLTVPFGTSLNLAPTYTLSTLATCSPTSGSTQNFSTPQTYTVTAQDLSTKSYTVTLTVAPEATTFTWNSALSGNWSVPANWTNNSGLVLAPNAAGSAKYTLNFNQAGTYTPAHDLNNNFLLNQLNLAATATISGNSLAFSANGPTLPQINQSSSNAITFSAPIVLNANLTFGGSGNGTVALSSNISGTGSLTKSCSGTMTLSGTNSHGGGTTISTGTLTLGGTANTLLGTGTVTLASGCTLALNGNNNLINTFVLNGGTVSNGNSFSANLNGPITFGATNTFSLSTTGNMTLGGNITGPGGLIKLGTSNGPLILTGSNSFTGPVTISEGSLTVSSFNSVTGGTATSSLGAPTILSDATISLGSSANAATLTYTGPGETTDRVIRMNGTTGGVTLNQSGTVAGLATTRGTSGHLKFTADLSVPGTAGVDNRKTLTLTSTANSNTGFMTGTGEISGVISDSILGVSAAQRVTSLTKSGVNTWILSGNNTYTGTTTISAGTLAFTRTSALGSGPLLISTGARARIDYIGTRQISLLTLNGISQPNGTYGSTQSNASNKNDTWFSGPGTITIGSIANPTTTALALTTGSNPSNGGVSVTFTATVTGPSPTGSVQFYDGITLIGTATLNGSSQASITTATLAAGPHALTALYPGTVGNSPSSSALLTHTVIETRAATTTSVARTAGASPSTYNAAVTFTATVNGSSPTGSVTFSNGTTILGTAPISSGSAVLTTRALPPGWNPISARYSGDASNAPSQNPTVLFHSVNPPAGNGKLKIFVLAGQSNMQGKGNVEIGRNPNNFNDTNFAGGLGSLRNMLNKFPNQYSFLADPANPVGANPGWQTRSDVRLVYWSGPEPSNANPTSPARQGNLDPYFGNEGEGPSNGNSLHGPDYAFGINVGSQLADQVLLIKYAFGGKSLKTEFRPPGAVAARGGVVGPYYTGMVARVNHVIANLNTYVPSYSGGGYEIVGLGWHQGFNDRVDPIAVAEYEANMTNLIHDLRTAWSAPNMLVSIGNTGMDNAPSGPGSLVEAQANVADPAKHPEFTGTVATVDTRPFDYGLSNSSTNNQGFHWHRNAESYYYIGDSMAKAMLTMLPANNSLPAAASQTLSTPENTALPITLTGSDPESSPLTYSIVAQPTHGVISGTEPNFTYTPNANYDGPDSFTFAASDGSLTSDAATVSITVTPSPFSIWASNPSQGLTAGVNDAPTDDPDFDGINNLMEFALNGLPTVSSTTILPTLTKPAASWVFAYDRSVASRPAATTQIVEYDDDLTGWTQVTIPLGSAANVTITPQGATDRVEVTLPPIGAKGFVRLKVNP